MQDFLPKNNTIYTVSKNQDQYELSEQLLSNNNTNNIVSEDQDQYVESTDFSDYIVSEVVQDEYELPVNKTTKNNDKDQEDQDVLIFKPTLDPDQVSNLNKLLKE